jgi:hypothetical protein
MLKPVAGDVDPGGMGRVGLAQCLPPSGLTEAGYTTAREWGAL